MILVFRDRAAFDAFRDELVVTPAIETGVGPVMIGEPAQEALPGTRCAIAYEWADIDVDWLKTWTSGDTPAVVFTDTFPVDWVVSQQENL